MANSKRETLQETLERDAQSMRDCQDVYTLYIFKLLKYHDLLSSDVCSPGFRKHVLKRMDIWAETEAILRLRLNLE